MISGGVDGRLTVCASGETQPSTLSLFKGPLARVRDDMRLATTNRLADFEHRLIIIKLTIRRPKRTRTILIVVSILVVVVVQILVVVAGKCAHEPRCIPELLVLYLHTNIRVGTPTHTYIYT